MVKIRLKRVGAKRRPYYRIVVADTRSPRNGRFIESLGFYDPLPDPVRVSIDAGRVTDWLRKGARPTESARHLLQRQGILAPSSGRTPSPRRPAGSDRPEAAAGPAQPAGDGGAPTSEPAGE